MLVGMWHASSASSSESDGEDVGWRAAMRRMHRPDNEIPASVPFDVLLGRTDDVAVALTGALAFTTGLEFRIAVRSRTRQQPGGLIHDIAGHHQPGPAQRGGLLLGFEFADGATVTNFGAWPGPPGQGSVDEGAPTLAPGGGGGSDHAADHDLFLAPVPPPGELVVVCAWPALDLPETRTVLNGTLAADAAQRAIVLWPEPDDEPSLPVDTPPPDVPTGGWFARVIGRSEHGHS